MLKAVLIDIFPNIISQKQILNFIWDSILREDEINFLTDNEQFSHWIHEDITIPEKAEEFLKAMENVPKRANKIVKEFKSKKNSLTKQFFKTFKFNETFIKFFNDAIESQCVVIINNNKGKECEKLIGLIKKPKGVFTDIEYGLTDLHTIEKELSNKNIALKEFLFVSSDQSMIDTIVKKGCFCVRINESGTQTDDEFIHTISSISDLDFGNLAFKFYDSEGSDDDGGL